MELKDEILGRQGKAKDYLVTKRLLWDKAERVFHNQLDDAISSETKSQVFDPKLSTLTLERAYRVMAQLGVGKVKPISVNDIGTSLLMNLVVEKYVTPNANAQFDLLTKFRMADIYSNIYGNFFALVDWDIRNNGYIGPDLWLLNIRDVFPQVGAVSVDDSDYIIVRSWKPLSYFENLKKQNGFKNVGKIYKKLKDLSGGKATKDQHSTSKREEKAYPRPIASKKDGYFEVLSQFEKDRWVDFCVEADMEFRDIKNPHDNGELPIVCKYSIPLLDDFMGMGDFERGMTMQNVVNSIWNLYLDATKMSIFPPVLVNKDNIASASSFTMTPAAKWLARGNLGNVAVPLQLNPKGIETFNNTYQVANAAMLNMFGTTDTTVTAQTEAGFGKTPQALGMQQARENTRDNADRFYMEQFITKVMKKMVNLISKKQSKAITIRLFEEDIKQLERSYPDVKEDYDEKTGKLTIDKKKTGSVLYDYELVSNSTYAIDQKSQQQNLVMLMDMFMKAEGPNGNSLEQRLVEGGYNFNFGELFKRVISNSGIQDWDKIVEEKTDAEKKEEQILAQASQQFEQAMAQMGGMNTVPSQEGMPPEQGINEGQPGY